MIINYWEVTYMRGRPRKVDIQKIHADHELRANEFADMVIDQHMTIRQIADKVGMSKSCIHKYLTTYVDSPSKKKELEKALKANFNQKHLHGGEATKKMYAERRKENKKK